MIKIFGYIIIKAAELPAIEKAHKLARTLTDLQIDDILAGKKHIHRNPVKRKAAEPELIPADVLRAYDKVIAEANARSISSTGE